MSPMLKASLEEGYRREVQMRDLTIEVYDLLTDKSTVFAKALCILIDIHSKSADVYRDALKRSA